MISSHDMELVAASELRSHASIVLIVVMLTSVWLSDKAGGGSNECGQYIKKPPLPSEITQPQELIRQYEETGKWSLNTMIES